MYTFEEIQAQKDELRQAVLHAMPFRPVYVKMKVFYGCNLKCEMCKHWRERREQSISSARLMTTNGTLIDKVKAKRLMEGGAA